MSIASKSLMLN